MDLYEAETRVAAGAEWMDANAPGWMASIDLNLLDVKSPFKCVLGQVFHRNSNDTAGYFYAVDTMLGNETGVAVGLGFQTAAAERVDRYEELLLLTQVWRQYITAKRAELTLAA
jgi:hypothetical protein